MPCEDRSAEAKHQGGVLEHPHEAILREHIDPLELATIT